MNLPFIPADFQFYFLKTSYRVKVSIIWNDFSFLRLPVSEVLTTPLLSILIIVGFRAGKPEILGNLAYSVSSDLW